jgi:hypothetical protein
MNEGGCDDDTRAKVLRNEEYKFWHTHPRRPGQVDGQ